MGEATYVVIFAIRQHRVHLDPDKTTSLVGPSPGDIAHRVATSTEHKSWQVEFANEVDAVGMAAHAQIEATQAITRQTVSAALENDSLGLVVGHHGLNHRLEYGLVGLVGNAVSKREVDSVILSNANPNIPELASSREVLAILVEGDSHDSIRSVKRLLDTIAMVDVDIDVENALLVP